MSKGNIQGAAVTDQSTFDQLGWAVQPCCLLASQLTSQITIDAQAQHFSFFCLAQRELNANMRPALTISQKHENTSPHFWIDEAAAAHFIQHKGKPHWTTHLILSSLKIHFSYQSSVDLCVNEIHMFGLKDYTADSDRQHK